MISQKASKEILINWMLEQFKHMGAPQETLVEEENAMWLDPVRFFYNLDFFDINK